MRHDICYRDNDTPTGKRECDRKILVELNALIPKGRREKVVRQLVRSIIELKHRMGLGIHWSNQLANELHKPDDLKNVLYSLNKSIEYGLQIYKYLLTMIDVFS